NPASDKLTVTSEETVDRCDVFSVTGALLYSCALGTKSFDLDVATLPAGMYFIRLNTENKTMMKKFMKK
ncbi:MAG: T9SS type A sorting domain-containing protein, partial [Bacteroidales bacterium]|nr:T9SS type A sorting domain-containing protein [Bacteroidales bacterium]